MIRWESDIRKFDRQGEKTGWTYILIPEQLAQQLFPGNKRSFRVKGSIDKVAIALVAVLPMGDGDFILPLNATLRKQLRKQKGDKLRLALALDLNPEPFPMPEDFDLCLDDEPRARKIFDKLPKSHRNYYIKWINSAKTEPTRVKRIAQAVSGLARQLDYGAMIREARQKDGARE